MSTMYIVVAIVLFVMSSIVTLMEYADYNDAIARINTTTNSYREKHKASAREHRSVMRTSLFVALLAPIWPVFLLIVVFKVGKFATKTLFDIVRITVKEEV